MQIGDFQEPGAGGVDFREFPQSDFQEGGEIGFSRVSVKWSGVVVEVVVVEKKDQCRYFGRPALSSVLGVVSPRIFF